jgi:SAM-dependent methyltransferase/NAD(P)-dependent dehydrogenase (short-subunit alcohol dehydrogenase family)/acyl carrier protein
MLHELVWRPLAAADGSLPAPPQIAEQVEPVLLELAGRHGLDRFADFVPELDRLAAAYVVQALQRLGLNFAIGDTIVVATFAKQAGVLPAHRRLFERLFLMLAEDGLLRADGEDRWRVVALPPAAQPDVLCDTLLARFADCDAELALTRRCARELAAVLRGQADPLALLFPGGSLADTERLYRHSPPAKTYNGLIAEVFGRIGAALPAGRTLRVLEIGAGTGSTTSHLLARLPAQVEYTFTDVSPLFLNRARDKFGDRAFMRYSLLDIGQPPQTQGFNTASYDVIVAANVLHATADLDVTLRNVHELLAPGGLLVLLEGTTPQRFGDLTVGLLDGWWAYADTARRDYALMSRTKWLALLRERGFEAALALPGETDHPVLTQQAVFVAQRPAAAASRPRSRWLLLPDESGHAAALAASLRDSGDAVELLPADSETLATALPAALAQAAAHPFDGLLALQALDLRLNDNTTSSAIWQGQERLVRRTLALLHGLTQAGAASLPPLWLITRGAQAARPDEAANPAQASLWGLSHVIAIEHPELRCRRLDLDPAGDSADNAAALLAELRAPSVEDQIALRGPQRLARRLVPRGNDAARTAQVATAIDAQCSYLVTGGLRGLGLRVAQWLADQGARHLVLMGRQAPQADAQALIERLRARGVQVLAATGDVAVEADLQRVLDQVRGSGQRLAGVVHSAGALDDGVLVSQRWDRFATAMAAKVRGSWNLHTLCGELDFLVLFSSGASVAGSAGQANHAAANAFEDALAWYRQARGQPTVSINWGPWADIGAAADRKLSGPGYLHSIAPDDGLRALAFAMRRDAATGAFRPAQLAVLASDWSQLGRDGDTPAPLFTELLPRSRDSAKTAGERGVSPRAAEPPLRERLAATAPNRRRALLRDEVRKLAAKVLGLPRADELNVDEPLRQLGLDSLMAVELRNLLGKLVGQTLPATITFDHPSVAALVEHLALTHFANELSVLVPAAATNPPATVTAPIAAAAAAATPSLDTLSEDELALQLLSRLDGIRIQENS